MKVQRAHRLQPRRANLGFPVASRTTFRLGASPRDRRTRARARGARGCRRDDHLRAGSLRQRTRASPSDQAESTADPSAASTRHRLSKSTGKRARKAAADLRREVRGTGWKVHARNRPPGKTSATPRGAVQTRRSRCGVARPRASPSRRRAAELRDRKATAESESNSGVRAGTL